MSSKLSFPNRSQFFASYNRYQPFSFPNSIIYYISKNPSTSKLYQKMIQSCKYFFVKNTIIVISELYYTNGWKVGDNIMRINMNLNVSSRKLWITEFLSCCRTEDSNILSSIFKKIYRCEVLCLYISNQVISFDQLLLLSSNVLKFRFINVIVKYNDGSIVSLEKTVKAFPEVKNIDYTEDSDFPSISSHTFKELLKLPHFLTVERCKLRNVSEEFDIESFYIYMKKNQRTFFIFHFGDSLSRAYNNRLKEICDEIDGKINHDYKPPYMSFTGKRL